MIPDPIDSFHLPMGSACLCRRVAGGPRPVVDRLDSIADLLDLDQADDLADRLANRQCPAEWWGLRVDLRCLRAAVDRGGGVSIAGRVELGHGALGAVAELEPLIGIV
jgi:hypothetical protein